ncbi:MAG TPA: N-acetyltransferase [Methanobacterium sp.]|nr:N-acetyltransferase [Methanobacterium sp.]
MIIRHEKKSDYSTIYEINKLAFNGENESKLIQTLRKSENFNKNLSLVAVNGEKIVGHILFTPITIETKEKSFLALALAPLAVHPEFQNQGIGSLLIKQGLNACKRLKYGIIIVIGHPKYYPRFGFIPAINKGLKVLFEVREEAFLVKENISGSLNGVEGTVKYPQPFLDLI